MTHLPEPSKKSIKMPKTALFVRELVNLALVPLSFRLGKVLIPPTAATLFLTKRCNSRCSICAYWREKDFEDELTEDQWIEIVNKLKRLGVKLINFSADGEVFLRTDYRDIMQHARDSGFALTVNTNGLLLERVVDDILSLDPMQVQVSLDTFSDAAYRKLRGVPNGFSKVRDAILAMKAKGFNRISVGSVLTKDNLSDLVQLQEFCERNELTYRITAFQFEGFNIDNHALREAYRNPSFLEKLAATLEKLKNKPLNNTATYLDGTPQYFLKDKFHPLDCMVGYYRIFVLPNGDVSLCNMMHGRAAVGNAVSSDLSELWFSEAAYDVRDKIKKKACPSCWLSCFAEDNLRFDFRNQMKDFPYFVRKVKRLFL
jgi:radical SAM protein with 4Fe4S-binding SPASM domain